MIGAPSFAKKLIVKSFNVEKFAKKREKKRFPQASKVVNTGILETMMLLKKNM